MKRYETLAHTHLSAGNYNGYHAYIAAQYFDPKGKDVLVVGCNRGDDCRYFVEMGANSVTGLDIMSEIGQAFADPKVRYEKASAEAMPFATASFDLVYAFATMEHVPRIEAAYSEMARVCRKGGGLYCLAAPLWNTRHGPHWGNAFHDLPWAHLRLSVEQIIEHAERSGKALTAPQIRYLVASPEMNKRFARDYLAACWSIKSVDIMRNDIDLETDREDIPVETIEALHDRGFSDLELFGLTHYFVAKVLAEAS